MRLASGVDGVDDILGGGLTPHRMYLDRGCAWRGQNYPCLAVFTQRRRSGRGGLYVTLSETKSELVAVAASHGWDVGQFTIIELLSDEGLDPRYEQTVLHPAEVELGETVRDVIEKVDELKPARLVFDSLSELRLLSQNPLRYRRQILALKRYFATRACTVLLLDDNTCGARRRATAQHRARRDQSGQPRARLRRRTPPLANREDARHQVPRGIPRHDARYRRHQGLSASGRRGASQRLLDASAQHRHGGTRRVARRRAGARHQCADDRPVGRRQDHYGRVVPARRARTRRAAASTTCSTRPSTRFCCAARSSAWTWDRISRAGF